MTLQAYPAKKRPDVGISIPSPTSTCPGMTNTTFREVGPTHPGGEAGVPGSAIPSPPVISNDELRRQFDELLVQVRYSRAQYKCTVQEYIQYTQYSTAQPRPLRRSD